jgi:Rab GDP dissociation inhibitor
LVKILLHCKVTRYLDFKSIDASYVFKDKKVQKVPATPAEALASELMGFFEKRKFRNFLIFVNDYDKEKPATWMKGKSMDKWSMKDVYAEYGLDENTQSFIGHAMALMRDDDYLNQPAQQTIDAIQLYCYSIERYGKSPYIYPLYGLGTMPEGFSRLAAVNGGTFMLNTKVDEVLEKDGKAWGIKSGNAIAKAKFIIGDHSYFSAAKSRVTGQVVRSICILDHPIAGVTTSEGTVADSVQIIIPARQVGRRNDIYVCMVSSAHSVSSNGKYIAIVSTTVETREPIRELEPGIQLLGKVVERFDKVSDLKAPVGSGKSDNCYISQTYDATSHFETAANDVLDLYTRITGTQLDMNINADSTQEDE